MTTTTHGRAPTPMANAGNDCWANALVQFLGRATSLTDAILAHSDDAVLRDILTTNAPTRGAQLRHWLANTPGGTQEDGAEALNLLVSRLPEAAGPLQLLTTTQFGDLRPLRDQSRNGLTDLEAHHLLGRASRGWTLSVTNLDQLRGLTSEQLVRSIFDWRAVEGASGRWRCWDVAGHRAVDCVPIRERTVFAKSPSSSSSSYGGGGVVIQLQRMQSGTTASPTPSKYQLPLPMPLQMHLPGVRAAYVLKAILCHSGDIGGGHYVTYVQDASRHASGWLLCDDASVTSVQTADVLAGPCTTGYLYYYEPPGREPSSSVLAASASASASAVVQQRESYIAGSCVGNYDPSNAWLRSCYKQSEVRFALIDHEHRERPPQTASAEVEDVCQEEDPTRDGDCRLPKDVCQVVRHLQLEVSRVIGWWTAFV